MTPSLKRTVVIVDDHPDMLATARKVAEAAGLHVVGEAADGLAALAAIEAEAPDVVLLDVRLPGMDGIAVAGNLAQRAARPCVVLMSADDSVAHDERVKQAPVHAVIPKRRLSPRVLRELLA